MTTTIAPDSLFQVQDIDDRWHAAAAGPGVLCQTTSADLAAPAVQTVSWDYGTNLVCCRPCLQRVAELEAAAA